MRHYSRQTLASYAFFDNARRSGNPPQHALVPLALPFLNGKAGEQFKPDVLASSLQQMFGPNFTAYSVEGLSKGLLDEGYIRSEDAHKDGAIFLYTDKVNDLNVEKSVSDAEADIDLILVEFHDYLYATTPIVKLTYTDDQWRDMFISWATTLDVSDKQGLQSWIDGFIAGEKKLSVNLDGNMDVEEKFFGIDRHLLVIFASFAKWLDANRADLFAKLATLAEIGFLIDLVSELREPVRGRPTKITLSVVLDGPVILDVLGLMGAGRKAAAVAMLKLCGKNSIPIIALHHSVEEARDIVRAVINKAAPARHGLVADTLKQDRLAERRAMKFLATPDQEIKAAGIQIINSDVTTSHTATERFSDTVIQDLAARLPYQDGYVGNRRTRDAKSVGFVMRRRNGHYTSDMFDSRYVMLTRSVALSKGAESYIKRNISDVPNYAVPPVLEVRHFSTMFLLAFGTSDGEEISRGELLSSCERVMKTSPKLMKKVRETVEQLSLFTKEELDAVMMDPVALFEVTTVTGNDPEVVSVDTAEALVRVIHEAAAKNERIQHQKELRNRTKLHNHTVAGLKQEREAAKLTAATTNMALQKNQLEADATARVLINDAYAEARILWGVVIGVVLVLSVLAVANLFLDTQNLPLAIRIAFVAAALILACYTLANRLIDQFSFLSLRRRIRAWRVNMKLRKLPSGLVSNAIQTLRAD